MATCIFWTSCILNVAAYDKKNYVSSLAQVDFNTLQTMSTMSQQSATEYLEENYGSIMSWAYKYKIGRALISHKPPVLEEIIFQSEKDDSYKQNRNVVNFIYRFDFVDRIDGEMSVYIPVWYKNGVINADGTIYFDLSDKYNVNATKCKSTLEIINNQIITSQIDIYNTEVITAQQTAQ